jgi:uncharacterized membrane protein YcaP (DUF421 family)
LHVPFHCGFRRVEEAAVLEYFYDGLDTIIQISVSAPLIYVAVIGFVRLSGKRTTAQMNNFDWIVAVALGSLVATGLVNPNVAVADAVFAVFALIFLQYLFTLAAFHSRAAERVIKAEPRVLLRRGSFLREAMRRERITEDEILAAVRTSGAQNLEDVAWVILESDASMSVIKGKGEGPGRPTALRNVSRPERGRRSQSAAKR